MDPLSPDAAGSVVAKLSRRDSRLSEWLAFDDERTTRFALEISSRRAS